MVQCIVLVCCLVWQLKVLLFDEFFGVLDEVICVDMQQLLLWVIYECGIVVVLIIYDIDEVLLFFECILLLGDSLVWIFGEWCIDLLQLCVELVEELGVLCIEILKILWWVSCIYVYFIVQLEVFYVFG